MLRGVIYAVCCSAFAVAANPPLSTGPWGSRDPIAPNDQAVVSGKARFTVLTPRLLRIEFSSKEEFEDRATVAVINRNLDKTMFTVSVDNDTLTLETDSLRLAYSIGEAFTYSTLSVTGLDASSAFRKWHFGQTDHGNLLGTIRTLDQENLPPLNCSRLYKSTFDKCGWDQSDCACEWGVLSKDGWAVVDDSKNYALSDASDFWDGPNKDDLDLYLFAHGHDYKAALSDFIQVSGRVAMVPRQALGVWFTRW
mmetsp:Transcript_9650/g.22029  ORF Transcript_9650/g.22029 Transcript_9650/m.22029 type:complete len:252 (-) Transcript_9650:164-919(-)